MTRTDLRNIARLMVKLYNEADYRNELNAVRNIQNRDVQLAISQLTRQYGGPDTYLAYTNLWRAAQTYSQEAYSLPIMKSSEWAKRNS